MIFVKISVVIITNNRRGDLEISIPAFMRQTYRNFEIIVIDNASNDGTREMMAEKYPQIRYFRLPDNFDIRSINIGIDFSDGDIIWRTDCDSCPETPDEFQKVIDIFASHPEIDIIATAEVQVHNGGKIWDWYPLPPTIRKTSRMTAIKATHSSEPALQSAAEYSTKSAASGALVSKNSIFPRGQLLPALTYAIFPTYAFRIM